MSDSAENQESGVTPESRQTSDATINNMQYKLKERYIIDFAEPIETLNMNGGKAYQTSDRIDKDRLLFALICGSETTPRHSILPYIKSLKSPHLLNLIEYGVVTLPNNGGMAMALIYQQPVGGRVIDDISLPFREDIAKIQSLWSDLLSSLRELHSCGITHRAIRLDNLFYADEEKKNIVLGDCAASFPAYYQPAVYETVESLMAKRESRGNGTTKNDIYALAVLGVFLYLGKENGSDLPPTELLNFKIKKGSFAAITGSTKLPIAFSNILRGMLADVPDLRWNLNYTADILENKPGKINFTANEENTKKAFTITGQKYYTPTDVAYAIMQSPKEAYDLYAAGKITDWIKNSLENEEMAQAMEHSIKATTDNTSDHEIVLAKVCVFLAPHFPIKFGGLSLFPNALSKSIYFSSINHEDLNDYARLCNTDLLRLWYVNQSEARAPASLPEIKSYINNQAFGFGLDRIMYEFDEDIPCTSKLVEHDYVCTPTRVLRVLNKNYNNSQEKPYDSNLLAYLRCKMGKKIDGILVDINSKIPALEASAILRLYTTMQNKFGPQQLEKLAQWLSVYSVPLIKSYHNKKYQKFLEKELIKINKSGRLYEIHDLLENEESRRKDNSEFNIAKKTAAKLSAEKSMLIGNDNKWEEAAKDLAVKSACFLAVIVMIISFVINLFGALK